MKPYFTNAAKNKAAQATIELTLALIVLIILLAGIFRFFIWSSKTIVGRHNAYSSTLSTQYNVPNERFYVPEQADLVPDVVR